MSTNILAAHPILLLIDTARRVQQEVWLTLPPAC